MSEPVLLFNRYVLEHPIGRGGMGDVFAGRDTQTGERVAIKRMRRDIATAQPDTRARFQREIDLLYKLNHPNIVKILAAGESNGEQFLVLEYVGGGTLADLLKQQPQLPIETTLAIALELTDALARTHHLNILHRDIKPANVLLSEDGTPRLTDFGLAFADGAARLTQPGIALGTWLYISPEVCTGATPDERSDVWSFGVMLYQMLTGRVPFNGDSPAAVVRSIISDDFADPSHFRADIPAGLRALIQRMLMKDAALRPISFRQIGAELETLIAAKPSPAAHPLTPVSASMPVSVAIDVQWTDEHTIQSAPLPPRLITKITTPPVRARMMQRSRLLQILNDGLETGHRLTLISAPPGFGKTTLTTMWAAQRGDPVAWLSLDEGDNDPVQFLRYLVGAFQSVDSSLGGMTAHLLDSPQIPPAEALIAPLINDVQVFNRPIMLALDDYHLITESRVHEAVRFLIDHLPPRLHAVIVTREDPPLPLGRMRVRSVITEIRERDLRFTNEETTLFLREVMQLELDSDSIQALITRTEGWAAALQLVSLSLQEDPADIASIVADFAGDHRYIVDYLLTEVLERQPADVRTFLRQTSLLQRFNAPLCDAVTGRTDSRALLEHLEAANLFLLPLDHRRMWYRYHQLFADVLRHTLSNEERAELSQRAANWLDENGMAGDAIRYALDAAALTGSYEAVIALIRRHADPFTVDGRFVTVLGWLDSLPDSEFESHPDLLIMKAWVTVLTDQIDRAELLCSQLEMRFDQLDNASQGRLRLAQTFLALVHGDPAQTIDYARQAAERLEYDNSQWRLMALWSLAEAQERSEPLPHAIASLREAAQVSRAVGKPLFIPIVEIALAHALRLNGQRDEAEALCHTTLAYYREQKYTTPAQVLMLCTLARIAYDANALDDARAYIEQARATSLSFDVPSIRGVIGGIEAQILAAEGDLDGALLLVRRVLHNSTQPGPADHTWLSALEGDLLLRQGALDAAEQWAENSGLHPDQPLHYLHMEQHLVYARLLLAQEEWKTASAFILRIEAFAEQRGYIRYWMVARLLRVCAARHVRESGRVNTLLADAVLIAERERCVRIFVDDVPEIAPMLPQVRQQAPAFIDTVLDAMHDARERSKHNDLLSEREREVLILIAGGLSNSEIAERLVLSTGTIKQHINHIFSKLSVRNRTQAISKARELRLID